MSNANEPRPGDKVTVTITSTVNGHGDYPGKQWVTGMVDRIGTSADVTITQRAQAAATDEVLTVRKNRYGRYVKTKHDVWIRLNAEIGDNYYTDAEINGLNTTIVSDSAESEVSDEWAFGLDCDRDMWATRNGQHYMYSHSRDRWLKHYVRIYECYAPHTPISVDAVANYVLKKLPQ